MKSLVESLLQEFKHQVFTDPDLESLLESWHVDGLSDLELMERFLHIADKAKAKAQRIVLESEPEGLDGERDSA